MIYPEHIARCQHIQDKQNAVRRDHREEKRKFCHFHHRWRQSERQHGHLYGEVVGARRSRTRRGYVSLIKICQMLMRQKLNNKQSGTCSFYGLQTASANLKRAAFEPAVPTTVVIDPAMEDVAIWRDGVGERVT